MPGGLRVTFSKTYLEEAIEVTSMISAEKVESMIQLLKIVKNEKGRIFFLGVGGSAANAGHAVNDFRKLAGIESYAPTDNVAELTARTNDEGWQTVFVEWLKVSNLNTKDCIFILSVGGGDKARNVSVNLCEALDYAKSIGARITGIVGRDGGYTATMADVCLVIPTVNKDTVTPHSESCQALIWHLMVSHPELKVNPTKW